ncbi:MAG: enoyl-CoA hydratase/isomerase family protein [Gammaproteobacteria bacterium]|nr:enoyl-CoA hydratase/isomerase family protein [Gammaproteobacteria bacterium]
MSTIATEARGAVCVLRLNRPAARQALDATLIAELTAAVHIAGADAAVRVVVLASSGPAFCAGADLRGMQRMGAASEADNLADAVALARLLDTLAACPKPVLAAVQGDCYGGGLGLIAACDIALASNAARFCLSEVRLGLTPATISPHVLRAIGTRAASRYMLTAERFDAAEALRMGLVHAVYAPEALDPAIDALLDALQRGGPEALRETKRLIADFGGRLLPPGWLEDTAARIAGRRGSAEAREGLAAFFGKRPPRWAPPGDH